MSETSDTLPEWRQQAQTLPIIGGFFKKRPKVAVIRLSGVIADGGRKGGISYARTHKVIEKAFQISGVKEVCFLINSPGGAPAQCALIGGLVRHLAEDKDVEVSAFVEDVAASGGYWLACAADTIYAQNSSIIGSIGVISASFGFDSLIEKYGVSRRVHTAGRDKSFMDPFLPEKQKDISRLKDIQKAIHEDFKAWVRGRREGLLSAEDKEIFEGGFWAGQQAQELGLIDGIGLLRPVMKEKYGQDVKFLELSYDKQIVPNLLGLKSGFDWADDAIQVIENRAHWSRFGL